MSDRIFGGLGVLLAVFFVWQATLIEVSFMSDPVGPQIFPIIIGVLLAISGAAIVLKPDADPVWPGGMRLFEIAMATAVMIAYAMTLKTLGFVIATALASTYLTWRLGTKPIWSLVSGTATALGIYAVFHLILGLSLARGPFGF